MRKFIFILILLFLVSCGLETKTPTPITRLLMVDEVIEGKFYFPLVMRGEIKTPTLTPTKTLTPTPTITPMPIKSLGDEFIKHGIRFGFAVSPQIRNTSIKNDLVTYHARVVTMENDYKMNNIQHTKGVFNFWGADQIILFGNENNIDVYGHGVSWSAYNPSWLSYVPNSE